MSRVTHSTVNPGDTNDRAVLNTVFTSWNAQTQEVDEENVAPQAIDRINVDFATNIFHKAVQATFAGATGGGTIIAATSYADVPTTVSSPVKLQFDLTGHEPTSRVVRCSFQVTSTGVHVDDFLGLQARLLESSDGTNWDHIADTERDLKSAIKGRHLRGNILLIGLVPSDSTWVGVEFIRTTTTDGSSVTAVVRVQDVVLYIDGYN